MIILLLLEDQNKEHSNLRNHPNEPHYMDATVD